jgi:hypothetical protein
MSSSVTARPGTLPPLRPPPFNPQSSPPPAEADPRVKFDSTPEEPTRMAGSRTDFVPDKALSEQIEDLERWALANARSDRLESIRFWSLRGVAFLGAAAAAATTGYTVGWGAATLAAISALAVAIDSAWAARSFRNPFRRALVEIRELENTVRLRWDKVRLAHPDPLASARTAHAMTLLDMIQARREEIGRYVGSVEAPAVER